jgi:adenylate cyclase
MGQDESATLQALKALRCELFDPKIAEYGGRIVKTTGDGLLLDFPSVVDAVRCAVDVQRGMAERNAGVPPDRRLEFRMGINVGDIIIDGDDIFGDGVNVAARLQTLAEPGGLCVSRVVRDQVLDKLSFTFERLGEQNVKNIVRPVEIFRVSLDGSVEQPVSRRFTRLTAEHRKWWPAAAIAVLSVVAVAIGMIWPRVWKSAPAPPALSVAILPFTAPAGTPADQQFADALTREVTAALGQWRMATVASYRSMSEYVNKTNDVRAVGRELNVRFLTDGTVQRAGDKLTVGMQLVDTGNAAQVWSDRVVFESDKASQDRADVVAQLTFRLRDALLKVESRRFDANANAPPSGSAAELLLRGLNIQHTSSDTLAGAIEAGKLYDQAIRLNPHFVTALAARVESLDTQLQLGRFTRAEQDRLVQEMDDLSQRAVAIDDTYPAAWYARTIALYLQGRLDAALEANTRYAKLEQTRAAPLSQRAWLMLFMGRAPEALELVNQSLARTSSNSFELSFALATRCSVEMRLGRYDETIADCEKAVANVDWWFAHALLAAAYAQKGDLANATAAKNKLLSLRPWYSLAEEKARQVSDNPTYLQQTETHFYAGLRKAGIPES